MSNETRLLDQFGRPLVPDLRPEQIIAPLDVLEEYTDEEILYWATPYFDELQAEKEKRKEHDATRD